MMSELDIEAKCEYAFEDGEAKGKAEIAKNLLAKGLDASFISEVTGLPVTEIEKLSGRSRANTNDAK
jgi:predicted transposase/invertase (TIGR01784 family)